MPAFLVNAKITAYDFRHIEFLAKRIAMTDYPHFIAQGYDIGQDLQKHSVAV